jgi:hypothetical protein
MWERSVPTFTEPLSLKSRRKKGGKWAITTFSILQDIIIIIIIIITIMFDACLGKETTPFDYSTRVMIVTVAVTRCVLPIAK